MEASVRREHQASSFAAFGDRDVCLRCWDINTVFGRDISLNCYCHSGKAASQLSLEDVSDLYLSLWNNRLDVAETFGHLFDCAQEHILRRGVQ